MTDTKPLSLYLRYEEPISVSEMVAAPYKGALGGQMFGSRQYFENSQLTALRRAHDQTQLNPEVRAATLRANSKALKVLFYSQEHYSYGPAPYIVLPGDGGVIVEWALGEDFVSTNIDSLNHQLDLIYFRLNGQEDCKDFGYDTLDELLTSLFSGEEITTNVPSISTIAAETRAALLRPDPQGSSASAYSYREILGSEGQTALFCIPT
ncbi:MAG: hypothetical protein WBD16_14780 [Pyrinomonadaceae bacterium]